jgi:hypothetical protein
MYTKLFYTLQLTNKNLLPYNGCNLQGFNSVTMKTWGYVQLVVIVGKGTGRKTVKSHFTVVDCKLMYNCTLGRPTLTELPK